MPKRKKSKRIDLTKTVEVLQDLITKAMCQAAFKKVRTNQRQRRWSLWALLRFWIAVTLEAPRSLTHALAEGRAARLPLAEMVDTTDEAFFQRCRDLSWKFFAEVFRRFIAALVPRARPTYCSELSHLGEQFTDVLIMDGSRLEAIARKLKILWDERAVVLPGCLLGVYDLFRGIPRQLNFCADAAKSELHRAIESLREIKRGTLIVADRLYCNGVFFEELRKKRLWGLFRRNKRLGLRRLGTKPLRKRRFRGGILTEWLVDAGSGATAPVQRLRLIRWKQGRTVRELLTNVLEPKQLTGQDAMDLYPRRWAVERMFYDLKVVLNLNQLHAANPNAVGMQVYAAAIVYAALRVSQASVAYQARMVPEDISTARFFPKMAAACHEHLVIEWLFSEIESKHH